MYSSTFKMKIILIVTLVAVFLTSCNKKNQFDVNFFMPDAKNNGTFVKFISSYCLKEYGIPLDSDDVLTFTDKLQKEYFGGVGVSGTITIDDDYIIFEPGIGTALINEGISVVKVPIKDVSNVRSESFLVVTKAVIVSTKNGELKFQLPKAKHIYNPFEFEDEELCNLIRARIK